MYERVQGRGAFRGFQDLPIHPSFTLFSLAIAVFSSLSQNASYISSKQIVRLPVYTYFVHQTTQLLQGFAFYGIGMRMLLKAATECLPLPSSIAVSTQFLVGGIAAL